MPRDPIAELLFIEQHCYSSVIEGSLQEHKDGLWTVFTGNDGHLVMVESSVIVTFLEGERDAALDEVGDFVRPACRVSDSDLTWDQAAAFIHEHEGKPLPPPRYHDEDADFEAPTTESNLPFD